MTNKLAEALCREASTLPDPLAEEVLDFIAFVKARRLHEVRAEGTEWIRLQEKSLAAVWDNEEDEVWNHVRGW